MSHIRHWEAAMFQGLVSDWPALDKWNIEWFCLQQTTLVEMSKMSFHSRDSAADKAKHYSREYLSCSEFLDKLADAKNSPTGYSTRNGFRDAPEVLALLNHEVSD